MTKPAPAAPLYLGDGVYARFDGFQVWITTTPNQRDSGIALEPSVMGALVNYAAKCGYRFVLEDRK